MTQGEGVAASAAGDVAFSWAPPGELEARLRFITDAAPVLISYVDREFRYRFVNRAYVEWFKRPAEEVVGRAVAEVLGEQAFTTVRPYLLEALAGRRTSYEAMLPYSTGPRYVHVEYVPDFAPADATGKDESSPPGREVRGTLAVVTDLSERHASEALLRESESARRASEAHLDLALEAASLGAWSFDPATGIAFASDEVRRLFAAQEGEAPADFWFSRLHPEDRARVEAEFTAAVTGQRPYDAEFRVVWPDDGIVRWVRARGRMVGGEAGRAPRLIGVAEDVTERVAAEREGEALLAESREAAARQRRLLREMLVAVTEGVLRLCDSEADLPERPSGDGSPAPVPLPGPPALKALRREAERAAASCGLPEDRVGDLLTAASEAAMNVVTHAAGNGAGAALCDPGRGVVRVWVTDAGPGIPLDRLHRAVLERGWTTAGSLGHGFWLMLRTADRVYLLTGPGGTTLVIEKGKAPPEPDWLRGLG